MTPADCPEAAQDVLERTDVPIILAVSAAAVALAIRSFFLSLRPLMESRAIVNLLLLDVGKLIFQFPVWAVVWVLIHLGGISLEYRFGPCDVISRLADLSFIVIPAAIVIAQLRVDRAIVEHFHGGLCAKNRYVTFHVLSFLLVAPLVFIALSVLEFQVRTPH